MLFRIPAASEIQAVLIPLLTIIVSMYLLNYKSINKNFFHFVREMSVIVLCAVLGLVTFISFYVWIVIALLVLIVIPAFYGAWRDVYGKPTAEVTREPDNSDPTKF